VDLGHTLEGVAGQHPEASQSNAQRRRNLGQQLRRLRITLLNLRDQRQSALLELGVLASQHPLARMWDLLDQACEALILDLDELRRLPEPDWQSWGLRYNAAAAATFVEAVAQRLLLWQEQLRSSLQLQSPPSSPRPALPLEVLQTPESLAAYQRLTPEQLQRVASRLVVLNRIDHTLASTEQQWRELVA